MEADIRNEKINYKVREHSLAKVPVLLVVGKREAEERRVSVRRLGSQASDGIWGWRRRWACFAEEADGAGFVAGAGGGGGGEGGGGVSL